MRKSQACAIAVAILSTLKRIPAQFKTELKTVLLVECLDEMKSYITKREPSTAEIAEHDWLVNLYKLVGILIGEHLFSLIMSAFYIVFIWRYFNDVW